MPQPRKYKTNADRQAAYRERKAARDALTAAPPQPGIRHVVDRVMAADKASGGA